MLYLYYGTDSQKRAKAVHTLFADAEKKADTLSLVERDETNFSVAEILSLSESQSLFGESFFVVIEGSQGTEGISKELLAHLAESAHHFVFSYANILKADRAPFEKTKAIIKEFAGALPKIEKFNVFALTDAFAARDKKNSWLLYTEAQEAAVSAQEIQGALFFTIKSMILAKSAKDAESTGLHPFVFKKSLAASKKFTDTELHSLSSRLLKISREGLAGVCDLDIGLEQFILQSL